MSKRKHESTKDTACTEPKPKKTKRIRKIKNSSGYGVEVNQMVIADNLTEVNNDNENENIEGEEEEEEEMPDNLTFGEKTLGLLVEGVNKFEKRILEYFDLSSKLAQSTNTHLSNLNKKMENFPQMVKSGIDSFSSSKSSFSCSSSDDDEIHTHTTLNKMVASVDRVVAAVDRVVVAATCINQAIDAVVDRVDAVTDRAANVAVDRFNAVVDRNNVDDVDHNADRVDAVVNRAPDAAVVNRAAVDRVDAAVDRVDAVVNRAADAAVDRVDAVVVDQADNLDNGRWDARFDTEYTMFKELLDRLIGEKIPRQFHHLNFKDMRSVTQVNLRETLDEIDRKNHLNFKLSVTFSLHFLTEILDFSLEKERKGHIIF